MLCLNFVFAVLQIFSEMIEWILLGVVAVLLYVSTRKPPNFPPGPPRLPVIGHMVKVSILCTHIYRQGTGLWLHGQG